MLLRGRSCLRMFESLRNTKDLSFCFKTCVRFLHCYHADLLIPHQFYISFCRVTAPSILYWVFKHVSEFIDGSKETRFYKVYHTPVFNQLILQRVSFSITISFLKSPVKQILLLVRSCFKALDMAVYEIVSACVTILVHLDS